jgi:hypothetical protein
MEGHIAAALHVEQLDATRRERVFAEQQSVVLGAASRGHNGRMLEEDQKVRIESPFQPSARRGAL